MSGGVAIARRGFKHCYNSAGDTLAAIIAARGSDIAVQELNLISSDGADLLSIFNTTLGENEYLGVFSPPSEPFVLQALGTDNNGLNFSHISDTAVEVSTINLARGMYLQPCMFQ